MSPQIVYQMLLNPSRISISFESSKKLVKMNGLDCKPPKQWGKSSN